MSHLLARGVILSPLPDLEAGANRTSSHALHPNTFVGIEENWSSFFADVMRFFEATPWRSYTDTISYRPAPNAMAATIFAEHVPCGDETTIQSRFIQNVNQQLNVVCKSTNVDMVMTDYKTCVNRPVSGVPDIVALNRAGILKVVGEMKVPWMDEHNLLMGKIKKNTCWKQLLGQIAKYMKEGGVRYGFLSNYNQTVFLKQDYVNSVWRLYVSDVVMHNTKSNAGPTLRQCFWYLLNRLTTDYHIENTLSMTQWVKSTP